MARQAPLKPLRYRASFRERQRTAIAMARRYRRAVQAGKDAGEAQTRGAALVCHPTGTGKTAVIAGLAHCAPEIGNVLILTTREAVRDQIVREVSGNIFTAESKFNLGTNIQLRKVCYAVTRGQDLENVALLRRATSRLLTGEVAAFAERGFNRIVADDRDDEFGIELARQRSILVMTVQMLVGLRRHHARRTAATARGRRRGDAGVSASQ